MTPYPTTVEEALAAIAYYPAETVILTGALVVDICQRLQAAESRRRFPRVPIRR